LSNIPQLETNYPSRSALGAPELLHSVRGIYLARLIVSVPLIVTTMTIFVAAILDCWKFRVHNLVTLPFLASGLIYHAYLDSGTLAGSLAGMLFGFATLFVFFLAGGMGAGDVKLMAGVGAWLGMPLTFHVFVAASLACGIYALVLMIAYGQLRQTLGKFKILWLRMVALGRYLGSEDHLEVETNRPDYRRRLIPFAAMMAIGITCVVIWVIFYQK
jgi:prepilin peptidase CpaA